MAFLDRIAAPGCALAWYVQIGGLPYVFSNVACPAGWDAGGGTVSWDIDGNGAETYQWSPTFKPPGKWGVIEQKVEPFAGIAVSGSVTLPFMADETWLEIMARSAARGGSARITDDLTAATTTIPVRSTTPLVDAGVASGSDVYLGSETMEVGSISSGNTSFTVATRGRYGSLAQHHTGAPDGIFEAGAGGGKICDHALVIRDRLVRVWIMTGTISEGVFSPFGGGPGSTADSERWVGWTQLHNWSGDLLSVEIECVELTQRLGRHVYQRKPTGIAGPRAGGAANWVRIDECSNRVYAKWVNAGDIDSAEANGGRLGELDGVRLQRSDGLGGYESVPDGWYTIGQVSSFLGETWAAEGAWPLPMSNTSAGYSMWVVPSENDDGAPIYELRIWSDDLFVFGLSNGWPDEFRSLFLRAGPQDSLWRELGFEGDALVSLDRASGSDTYSQASLAADRPPPAFRLPASRNLTRRVFYHAPAGPGWDATPGFVADSGDTIYGFARIGEEVVEFTSTGAEVLGVGAVRYLDVSRRATFRTDAAEVYVEQGPEYEPLQIRQCLAFPDTSWQRMALYLLLGDGANYSGYQQGWRGGGLAFPIGLVDIDSFEGTIRGANDRRDNWCISEPMPLRDLLSAELVLSQVSLTETNDGTDFRIRATDMSPPTETDGIGATDLNHDHIASYFGVELDDSDDRIVNVIEFKYAYNNGDGKYYGSGEFRLVDSIAMYGEADPIVVSIRGIGDPEDVQERMHSLGNALASSFGGPYQKIGLVVVDPLLVWPIQLGETLALTHDFLPSLDSSARGVSALPVRIYGKTDVLRDVSARGSFGRLTLVSAPAGERLAEWAPAARCTSRSGAVNTCAENYYSRSGEPADASHFDAPFQVRCYLEGDESSAEQRIVSGVSGNDISFSVATSLTPPFIIEFAAYDSVVEAQQRYAYMADGATELVDDGGDGVTGFVYL